MTRQRIIRWSLPAVVAGALIFAPWMVEAATIPMVGPASPDFAGYVWTPATQAVTSIGGDWNLPTLPPVTSSDLANSENGGGYGGLSIWIGVEGNYLAQTGTSTSEFSPALTVGQPNPAYPWRDNAPDPPQPWTGRRTPYFQPTNEIAAYLQQTATPGTWIAYLENLTTHIGYTAQITGSTKGTAGSAQAMWTIEDPNATPLPVQPITSPINLTAMTLNGNVADFWTLMQQQSAIDPGGGMELGVSPYPVDMSVSEPSTTGDGFAIQDGTVAPAPPPPNPTPGETINVVWPTDRAESAGPWNFTLQPGQSLTILGGGFGAGGTVTWNGIPLAVTAWASGSITATIPAGTAPGSGTIVVTPTGGTPTAWDSVVTIPTSVPLAGPTWHPLRITTVNAGGTVTLTGAHLGTTPGTARWNRDRFPWRITQWTTTQVTIAIPATAKGTQTLTIHGPGSAIHTVELTVLPKVNVPSPTPPKGSTHPTLVLAGTTIAVHGHDLGTHGVARWNANRFVWSVAHWAPTVVRVRVPVNAQGTHHLTLHPVGHRILRVWLDVQG